MIQQDDLIRVRDSASGETKLMLLDDVPPGHMMVRRINQYGAWEEIWVSTDEINSAVESKKPIHPPFADPRARKAMLDIYETFRDVTQGDENKRSPEAWEHGFRYDFSISQQVAYWLKFREVFTKMIRGKWNDQEHCKGTFSLIFRITHESQSLFNEIKDNDDRVTTFAYVVGLWETSPTVEQIRERIKEWLPPDVPVNRKTLTEKFGVTWDLPENPDVNKFLESVEVNIPVMPKEQLRRLARDSYARTKGGAKIGSPSAQFLDMICVNHLRHTKTDYDQELDRFLGKQPNQVQSKLHAALKGKILDAIATAYPWLEKECLRQKAELPMSFDS
jgi:hypothetical protein